MLMQKLAMQTEPAFRHAWDCKWARNARDTTAATFTDESICVFTDFAGDP